LAVSVRRGLGRGIGIAETEVTNSRAGFCRGTGIASDSAVIVSAIRAGRTIWIVRNVMRSLSPGLGLDGKRGLTMPSENTSGLNQINSARLS
jgi:hypothetical protein